MAMGKTTTWDANFVGIKKKASVLLLLLSLIALVEMAGGCELGYDSGEEHDEESDCDTACEAKEGDYTENTISMAKSPEGDRRRRLLNPSLKEVTTNTHIQSAQKQPRTPNGNSRDTHATNGTLTVNWMVGTNHRMNFPLNSGALVEQIKV